MYASPRNDHAGQDRGDHNGSRQVSLGVLRLFGERRDGVEAQVGEAEDGGAREDLRKTVGAVDAGEGCQQVDGARAEPVMDESPRATNSTMNSPYSPTTTKLAFAIAVMPKMFSTVTAAIETIMNTQAGMAGKAASM